MNDPAAGASSWIQESLRSAANRVIHGANEYDQDVLIWGPPGFGKGRIHDELVRRGARSAASASTSFDVPLLWVVEQTNDAGHRQLVAASRVENYQSTTRHIGPDQLAIRHQDLPEKCPAHAAPLIARCHGWPDLVRALSEHTDISQPPPPSCKQHADALVNLCTAALTEQMRIVAASVSRFARFTPEMVSAVEAEITVDILQRAGLPVIRQTSGWLTILEPVRSTLHGDDIELDETIAEQIERPLISAEGPVGAAEAFVAAGRPDRAGSVLNATSRRDLDRVDTPRLIAILEAIHAKDPDNGRVVMMLADAFGDLARFGSKRELLERAAKIAISQDDESLAIEAEAELLLLDEQSLTPDDMQRRFAALRARISSDTSQLVRTRLGEIEALALSQSPNLADIHEAAHRLELIASEWEIMGERSRAAYVLRRLSAGCLVHLGEYPRAVALLDRALVMVKDNLEATQRTNHLLMFMSARSADNDAFNGYRDRDTELVRDSEPLAWLVAFRSWAEMLHASFNSSSERVHQAQSEANARLGELHDGITGALFLAEAAVSLALVGDETSARTAKSELDTRNDVKMLEVLIVDATIAALFGSSEELQEALDHHAHVEVPAGRAWRLELLRFISAERHNLDAPNTLDTILNDAARFGLDRQARRLLDLADLSIDAPRVRVNVFGAIAVIVDGQPATLPPGKVTELVKLLVVRDRQLPLDVVIDHLWPEVDLDRGRARLRNCINRLRNVIGPEAIVRSGETLSLSHEVTSDLREFWAAIKAMGTTPAAARTAAELYAGNLLESDLYADWLYSERQAVASAMHKALTRGVASLEITDELALAVRHRLDQNE